MRTQDIAKFYPTLFKDGLIYFLIFLSFIYTSCSSSDSDDCVFDYCGQDLLTFCTPTTELYSKPAPGLFIMINTKGEESTWELDKYQNAGAAKVEMETENGCTKTAIVEHERNRMELSQEGGVRQLEIIFSVGPEYLVQNVENCIVEAMFDEVQFKITKPFFSERLVICERIDTLLQRSLLMDRLVMDTVVAGHKYDSLFKINDASGHPKILFSTEFGPVMLKTNDEIFFRKQG